MSQTRIGSATEVALNIVIGFVISLISQVIIFPLYGIHSTFSTDLQITAWFTVVSIVRSYALRRLFNRLR